MIKITKDKILVLIVYSIWLLFLLFIKDYNGFVLSLIGFIAGFIIAQIIQKYG